MLYLVLLFLVEGELVTLPGYQPLQAPNMELCLERKEFVEEYFEEVLEDGQAPYVLCLKIGE